MITILHRYVSAKLKGEDACRQGVCVDVRPDGITVKGQLGVYECELDATVVPIENLWGDTLTFARSEGVTA